MTGTTAAHAVVRAIWLGATGLGRRATGRSQTGADDLVVRPPLVGGARTRITSAPRPPPTPRSSRRRLSGVCYQMAGPLLLDARLRRWRCYIQTTYGFKALIASLTRKGLSRSQHRAVIERRSLPGFARIVLGIVAGGSHFSRMSWWHLVSTWTAFAVRHTFAGSNPRSWCITLASLPGSLAGRRPFSGQAAYHEAEEPSGTARQDFIFIQLRIPVIDGSLEFLAMVDTAAPWCIWKSALALQAKESLERTESGVTLSTRVGTLAGDLYRGTIVVLAEEGQDLEIEATVFVPYVPYEEWHGPNIVGYPGFLQRLRFAFDPGFIRFHFESLD